MPGQWITNQQVEIYMTSRKKGNTQETSAAKAGISNRSGRSIEQGYRQPPRDKAREWRTRKDPLASIWAQVLEPMLNASPGLQAITLLEHLQSQYPGEYPDSVLRTLQRRVKQWRTLHGPEKEVMFRQLHEPGQLGLSDFTQLKRVKITIASCAFEHLLYHFRLIYSKWSYMQVVVGGESYAALSEGLQNALHRLGGVPAEHRTDSLSAAFKNISQADKEDMTRAYTELCQHYGMKATRNNRGCGHENGGIESPHGHLKRRIEQALLLRGSHDFQSIDLYQSFIDDVVGQHNNRNAKQSVHEKNFLQALPEVKTADYTLTQGVVSSSSTMDVRRVTYSVPSRLIGQTLQVRLYDKRVVCYLGREQVLTVPRIYPANLRVRARLIDYRHVVHSLLKKPQAFRHSQIREDLLPNGDYQAIWTHVDENMDPKAACRFIVGLLYLAATQDCESELARCVQEKIAKHKPLLLSQLQDQFSPPAQRPPNLRVTQHSLQSYNGLLISQGVNYV